LTEGQDVNRSRTRQTVGLALVAGMSGAAASLLLAQCAGGLDSASDVLFCALCGALPGTPAGIILGVQVRNLVDSHPGLAFLGGFLTSALVGAAAGATCLYAVLWYLANALGVL
jgi:hypothetical protein